MCVYWVGGAKREREWRRKGGEGSVEGRIGTLHEMGRCFSKCPILVLNSHSGTGTRGHVLYMNVDRTSSIEIRCHTSLLHSVSPLSNIYRTPGPQNKSLFIHLKRTTEDSETHTFRQVIHFHTLQLFLSNSESKLCFHDCIWNVQITDYR